MKRFALLLLVLVTTAAFAQAPTRVQGTITAFDGEDLKIHLASNVPVTTAKRTTLEELKGPAGSQKVLVPPGTPIVAERLNVSKDGVRLPH